MSRARSLSGFAEGFLVFTLLVKIAVPILYGTFRAETPTPAAVTTVAG